MFREVLIPILAQAQPHAHGDSRFALQMLGILAAAALVAFLFRALPQATIPAYLIAGAVIGPNGLEIIGSSEGAESIASLSTILLMFIIGLHMDMSTVRGGLASAALITIVSTVLIIAILFPVGLLFGLTPPAAMGAAMALSISSTAVVLRILEQKREMHSVPGRLTFGVLLIQDLVAVALMGLLPPLAAWAGAKSAPADSTIPAPVRVLGEGLVAVGGIGAMIGIGRVLLPRMLRAAAGSAEVLLVVSAAIALGAAVATKYLGFSPELGGFLAGFLLSSTPFRFQLSGQLLPMRDLFLAVFFTAVGLELPLAAVADAWWAVLLAVAVVIAVKGVTIGLTAWAAGASASVAAYTGLAIAQASEFSLVIVKQANEQGVMDDARQGYGIAVVVLTMVVTPGLFQLAHRAAERAVRLPPAPWIKRSALRGSHTAAAGEHAGSDAAPTIGSAIIAGFGPVGRAVADALEKRNVKVTIVELNPRTVERQYSLGRSIVYGDVANPEVMERAGISGADAVILTVPDEDAVLRACRLVRMRRPDIFIAARVNALSKAMQALQLGADHTVVEEMATAEAMANQVLLKLADRAEGKDTGPRLYEFSS